MKAVKIAVVACSLFAAAAAWAQSEAPAVTVSQVSQAAGANAQQPAAKPGAPVECVGPVSFCNIYFGS
ncbi:hypothetical protein WJ542_26145 [Paraburkholderia sp. B3]|uniref:hypothetical protein n=1 Tax=Paraburkholderia sp. B3 TaxID=3134791 RepID=UPI003981E5E1